MEHRLRETVTEYARQGAHRTATATDEASAGWLAARMSSAMATAGAAAAGGARLVPFRVVRRTPIAAHATLGPAQPLGAAWTVHGVPLFDCASYTSDQGVQGTLGPAGSNCDVALVTYSRPNQASKNPGLMEARCDDRYKAILAAYEPPPGGLEGLALINAHDFEKGGVGKPTLQVHSGHLQQLKEAARAGEHVTLVASMVEEETEALNVEAEVGGSDPSLAPVVVITPRSGWWGCAVERGSGIAAFLEVLRAVAASSPRRTVIFSAATGHELGNLGSRHFARSKPAIFRSAHACFHIGANWGNPRAGAKTLVQASDPGIGTEVVETLVQSGVDRGNLHIADWGAPALGEARELHEAGARYVSLIGLGLETFHMEEDTEADLNMLLLRQLVEAFRQMVVAAAGCDRTSGLMPD